jgi:hypothetical protein
MGGVSGVKAGWYPDYADADGQLRYWDGQRWTDQRMPVGATDEHAARALDRGPSLTWVYVAGAAVVGVLVVALVVAALRGGDDERDSDGATASSATAGPSDDTSTDQSGDPTDADPSEDASGEPSAPARLWEVAAVMDSVTIELTNGAVVRLSGVQAPASTECAAEATDVLDGLVVGSQVVLVRKGPDRDAEGNLLRYVERDALDIGLRMIQRGLVTATDDAHPRAPQYHRVDDRTPAACS